VGSTELNTGVPHPARVYDCLLGGKDNFQADREAAAAVLRASPNAATAMRANRDFMVRVAHHLAADRGIRQFLDIGTGLPTSPNLHEVVQGVDRSCRVVYVDNDPIVLVHARALLTSTPEGRTAYIDADLRGTGAILASPQVTGTLDLTQPVALCLMALLHFLTDESEVHQLISRLVRPLAAGSVVVVSCMSSDWAPDEVSRGGAALRATGIPFRPRTRAEVEALFTGLDLVDPGVVLVNRWRPDEAAGAVDDSQVLSYGALAVKP
jgi:O-methyltransferase involved in polyketide biosynthesis